MNQGFKHCDRSYVTFYSHYLLIRNKPMPSSPVTIAPGLSTEIAFIDVGILNADSIISQFTPGTEVHLLNGGENAIAQITEILANRSNISAIHLFSHGSNGALQLGGEAIANLSDYDDELKLWSQSLTADADILLYGCNVAANETGKAFVNELSQLTGADVAASDDLTGLGGDWVLEYQTGTLETLSIADDSYASTLANLTVTTLNDVVNPNDGVISLREAITVANSLDGTDNIFFGVNGTITLGGGALTISSNLNIFGNGASLTTIDGNVADRVFTVSSGTVLLSGLTVTRGSKSGDPDGGGGLLNNGNLTLQNCTFSNNSAGLGGGITNTRNLTINSSTFTNNSATNGGGIINKGNLTVNSSTLSENRAVSGGGIKNEGGTATVNSSTFSGNVADFGGGFSNEGGSATINNSTFNNNRERFFGKGGGLFNQGGTINVSGTRFSNNTSSNGGGLYSDGEAVVSFSTFTNNQADEDGGGLYAIGVLNLGNSIFQGNRADAEGGGLYLSGSDAKVSLSTFLSNTAAEGGAIGLGVISGSNTLLVTDSGLRLNSATTRGGGIFAGAGDSVTLRRSQVQQNTAPNGTDLFGNYISGGFNVIGKGGGFTGIVNGVNGDVIVVP
jgi:predicted outer membrane repeat protein